jgi:protein-S-isoprenylcysteine O-methyltransferase Ste14
MTQSNAAWKEIKSLSVVKFYEPFLAIFIVVISYFFLYKTEISNVDLTLALVAISSFFYFWMEIYKQGFGKIFTVKQGLLDSLKNSFIKFLGVLLGTAFIFTAFWLFPEYHSYKYFAYIEEAVPIFLVFFLPVSFLGILAAELFVGTEKDAEYFFGKLFFLDLENINWGKVKTGILEWVIRLFFLTLNFLAAVLLISNFRLGNPLTLGVDFLTSVLSILGILYLLIIFTILPGYIFSSRLINTQVKKIDLTMLGWMATFVCYPPFFDLLGKEYLNYTGVVMQNTGQQAWYYFGSPVPIFGVPIFLYLLAFIIIISEIIHLWGESTMNIHSSNLTNRGIVTGGPYKFTKHPVYVSKCVGWFFIALPFLSGENILDSLRITVLFFGVVGLYMLRAYSEEKLLATDLNYVKYALWIDENGLFSFLQKFLPFTSFSFRLNYWKKNNLLKYE